ncbi:MAG: aspartate racemase [Polyangiaceae bacterium UTPRO1]|jgi:aspartate racemase|nr:aspartate/glutamate racemase family protein [Myxococcales bacterium]OQY68923.1 MAG: aspartate racemase [Polyangiaceae bacterium UTPRO1]
MKTIGLLGGMSWESTIAYYRIINRVIGARLGGLHSARIVLYSVEFAAIEEMQRAGRWTEAGVVLADAARRLEGAGAECLVICANTMHKVAPAVEDAITIPLLHIADATAARILAAGLRTVGLLGTRYTMEMDFYRRRLAERFGLTVLTPEKADREAAHQIIFEELCRGVVREESRATYRRIVENLASAGAAGIVSGCTEIGMLLGPDDVPLPLFDTAAIHAEEAALWALGERGGH